MSRNTCCCRFFFFRVSPSFSQVAAGVCAHAGEWQAVLRLAETLEPEESSRVAPWSRETFTPIKFNSEFSPEK